MPFRLFADMYSDRTPPRDDNDTSSRSLSICSDDNTQCSRSRCHCEFLPQIDDRSEESSDSASHYEDGSLSLRRRHGEHFHRPPHLGPYMRLRSTSSKLVSNEINLSYLQFEDLAEKEFCNRCQFCAHKGQWCGRRSVSGAKKVDPILYSTISDRDLGARKKQLGLINAPWVDEPLLVNMATIPARDSGLTEEAPLNEPRKRVSSGGPSHSSGGESSKHSSSYLDQPTAYSWRFPTGALMRQVHATDCTRLERRKDVRLNVNQAWAIQEGSLVIAIPEYYTHTHTESRKDEIPPIFGEVFVVLRMYADMWALCGRLSFHSPITTDETGAVIRGWDNIGFLPLCAVTLAANFASFEQRRGNALKDGNQSFAGGGLQLSPPERSHSAEAGKEIFGGQQGITLRLPSMVGLLCSGFSEMSNGQYVPLNGSKTDMITPEAEAALVAVAGPETTEAGNKIQPEKCSGTFRRALGKLRRSISKRTNEHHSSPMPALELHAKPKQDDEPVNRACSSDIQT